jgi:hypothetical protein
MPHARPQRFRELHESLLFLRPQKDPLLWHSLPEHFRLRFENLDLTDQLMFRALCQQEKQRLEESAHRDKIPGNCGGVKSVKLFVHRQNLLENASVPVNRRVAHGKPGTGPNSHLQGHPAPILPRNDRMRRFA